jgi:outer membrane protein assembly factor BamD (BamD/ComL family)
LAKKEFDSGILYKKLGAHESAIVYFSSVTGNYYDTEFAHKAMFWMAESLIKLNRKEDALTAYLELLQKYPDTRYVKRATFRVKNLQDELAKVRETNGVAH